MAANIPPSPWAQALTKPKPQAVPPAPTPPVQTPTPTPRPTTATPAAPGAALPQPFGVQYTPTNPAQDLRGQTISVAPTANRQQLAQQYVQNWNAASEPYYQRDLRSATSNAAAKGQIGSGQLRTSLGDLAYNRDLQRNTQQSNFLTQALEGTIDDAYKNVGIAQQQQNYQTGLQNQSFQQYLQSLGLQDSLTNSAFNRGVQSYQIGAEKDPQQALLNASNQAANNASQSFAGAGGIYNGIQQRNDAQAQRQRIADYLRSLGIGTYAPEPPAIPDSAFGY